MSKIGQMLTSMEVAQMVEKEHKQILKDIRRYTQQFNEGKISPVEFFTESTYIDGKGESRPCYLVTKKGCEFIAHKLTGQKGTEFTARYINRFHEMEERNQRRISHDVPVGEVARLSTVMDRIMVRQNSKPYDIARAFEMLCQQFGIALPENFVNVPEFEQLTLESLGK